jgi:hypothetical protein
MYAPRAWPFPPFRPTQHMHAPARNTRRSSLFSVAVTCRTVALGAMTLASVSMAACGGDNAKGADQADAGKGGATAGASACTRLDSTAAYVAVREYIKGTLPTPQRFLTAAGTDSAAPEDGFRAMQDKGPAYFYSADTVAQRKIREKLASVGPYASLLIVVRGTTTSPNGDTVTMRLGGHYVGGEHDGKVATSRAVTVVCRDSLWRLGTMTEEPAK